MGCQVGTKAGAENGPETEIEIEKKMIETIVGIETERVETETETDGMKTVTRTARGGDLEAAPAPMRGNVAANETEASGPGFLLTWRTRSWRPLPLRALTTPHCRSFSRGHSNAKRPAKKVCNR